MRMSDVTDSSPWCVPTKSTFFSPSPIEISGMLLPTRLFPIDETVTNLYFSESAVISAQSLSYV